jgi:organic radical activating enzyme
LKKELGILLKEGKVLPLMEEFYTLQGEGFHTGKAAYFARIGGCDVGCSWCDIKESWDARKYPPIDTNLIIEHASSYPAKAIVVTGGEPLMYNLDYLCKGLKANGIKTHLETCGAHPLSGNWDWICLSPKKDNAPLPGVLAKASELKVIIEDEADFDWAEENAEKVSVQCMLFLQPEWSMRDEMIPLIVKYIQENPKWKVSLQSHKYMHIP